MTATPEQDYLALADVTPSEVFTWRRRFPDGKGGERVEERRVRIALLSKMEELEALQAAQDTARAYKESPGYSDIYREAQACHLMARALRAVDKRTRPDGTEYYPVLYTDANHMLMSMHAGDIAQLLNCYEMVIGRFRGVESFDPGDVTRWIARLSDPLRAYDFLGRLDSAELPALTITLAEFASDLLRELGRSPTDSPPSSESDQTSSGEGTTSSSGQLNTLSSEPPPGVRSEAELGETSIPADIDEARRLARELFKK